MSDYVSLPAKRLSEMVKKYVHHEKIKNIKGIQKRKKKHCLIN